MINVCIQVVKKIEKKTKITIHILWLIEEENGPDSVQLRFSSELVPSSWEKRNVFLRNLYVGRKVLKII